MIQENKTGLLEETWDVHFVSLLVDPVCFDCFTSSIDLLKCFIDFPVYMPEN